MKIVPPGGIAGFGQMVPASRNQWAKGTRSAGGAKRKRRSTKRAKSKGPRTRRAARGAAARAPKKGSAAAKAWGKRMAALRKRKRG